MSRAKIRAYKPYVTEAQRRALTHLVVVGRRLEAMTRGHDKRATASLVPLGFAVLGESEFGPAWGATAVGRAWLKNYESQEKQS